MAKRTVVPAGKQRVRVAEGIYRKSSGKYLATFRDPGRKQHWKEFRTKSEAERWRARGHYGSLLRPTTRANWEQECRAHIGPALGSWPVGQITVLAVKDFMADLERAGAGAATRQKCRSILHRILEEAVENGEIASNPAAARGTRVKPSQPKKARNLTPDEVGRLLSAAGQVAGPSDALAIEVMFVLGLRIGEMAGLQARDVDLQRREITIQRTVSDTGGVLRVQDATKTNRYRVLPVAAELPVWGRLVEHIRQRGLIAKAHVFQARLGGPIRPNNWRRRVWDKAMESAKILEPPTPHSGRRTAASLLSAAGVPPATVQAILGLSTLKQTGEYIDVPRKEMEAGLRKLVSLYGKD